jgi:hypothetical protein
MLGLLGYFAWVVMLASMGGKNPKESFGFGVILLAFIAAIFVFGANL